MILECVQEKRQKRRLKNRLGLYEQESDYSGQIAEQADEGLGCCRVSLNSILSNTFKKCV